ncbi:MAG: hypothetical protein PVG32_00650, partial [Anaerolineales bacterium]
PTMTAAIAMYPDTTVTTIFYRFGYPTPALKGFTTAIGAFLWSFFCFLLDIWQSEYNNRHGRFLLMAV